MQDQEWIASTPDVDRASGQAPGQRFHDKQGSVASEHFWASKKLLHFIKCTDFSGQTLILKSGALFSSLTVSECICLSIPKPLLVFHSLIPSQAISKKLHYH